MPSDILDFHFTKPSNLYRLEVYKRGTHDLLAAAEFEVPRAFMSAFDLGQLDFDVKDPKGRVERIKTFGSRLYQRLFTADIAHVWSEHKKVRELAVLCIRISPDAGELEAIPWETLFDGKEFLAAGVKSTISRLPLDVEPLNELPPVTAPLRLLALISSPLDLPEQSRLQMEREQEILLEAVNDPSGQGRLQIEFEEEVKLEILESDLETPYQILHFSGHGMSAETGGGLLLENERGNSRRTAVPEVMRSLERGEHSLRLVVLSGCQTARTLDIAGLHDIAGGLSRRRMPAVIAMQFSVTDQGGLKFAEIFYSRIAIGRPVEVAIHAARRSLMLSDDPYLKADALASVLLAANGDCLRLSEGKQRPAVESPELDLSFYLPLVQLSYGFYGRRSEYRQVRDAIIQRNQRAVIIHGIGGIGKTALVSHVAKRLRPRFQGVYTFECSSGTLAPETIMLELHRYFEALGVRALEKLLFSGLKPDKLATYLSQLLSQWSLLLIFDNFESQLERSGDSFRVRDEDLRTFITTLVKATADRSHFLFTSRYWFDLAERRLGTIESVQLHDLTRPEALSLMQKLPSLGKASHEGKIKALQAFGGHPYALVTLDRHCQHRPLDQALASAKDIHVELREFLTIELNYAQLSDRAQQLLTGLAAFRKSVPYDAAEWVLGETVPLSPELFKAMRDASPDFAELDDASFAAMLERVLPERRQADNLDEPIRALVDWGLLTPIHDSDDVTGLSVHALVQEFCRDKTVSEIWREQVRDAAAYYTNSTKLIAKEEKSAQAVWAEMQAFELLMEIGDFQDAAYLLTGATELLHRWGFVHYLDSKHRHLLDVMGSFPRETAAIVHNFAYLLQSRGDYEQALIYFERSVELNDQLGNRASVAKSLHHIGSIHQEFGDYKQALDYYQRSVKIFEELGNHSDTAKPLFQIGMIQQLRGDYDQALDYYQRSFNVFEEVGARADIATALNQMGIIQQLRGDYDKALEYYERSLAIQEEVGNRLGISRSLHQIGRIHQERLDYEQALEYYQRSLRISEELSNRAGVSKSLHQIGTIQQERGEYQQALDYYNRSLRIAEEMGNRDGVASSLGQIGLLLIKTARYAEAFDHLVTALQIFAELESPNSEIAVQFLKTLRRKWGEESFDAAWMKATETDTPEWLK